MLCAISFSAQLEAPSNALKEMFRVTYRYTDTINLLYQLEVKASNSKNDVKKGKVAV